MNYDVIGDIHGHAEALKALLAKMGYHDQAGVWRHSDRTALFVGDFIDRGPRQVDAVDVVRRMVDARSAQAILGNHEFNAIAWYLPDTKQPGEFLRPHHSGRYGAKNFDQHKAFLNEVIGTPKHKEIIDWFLTLPLWLDLDGVRVVHACWHKPFMDYLSPKLAAGNCLTADLMVCASQEPDDAKEKDTPEPSVFKAIEALCKGIEIPLPGEHKFKDKDGHLRSRVRTRWWDTEAKTYRDAALLEDSLRLALPEDEIPEHVRIGHDGGTPVFIGHYWMKGTPEPLSDGVVCVDYSIAQGGKLVAYRWNRDEPKLDNKNFMSVG